ncbi:MAG: DeoR/GlpR transcriptional regulator [Ruminococcaceae bacterium]|nr:DeoR/GlpR transcriptional regulator [Oscillospiraceae bacterium]
MIADDRKKQILEQLNTNGTVRVGELSQLFDVSEVTIRSYLDDMEKKGLLSRIHGGAVISYKPYYNMGLNQRIKTNQSEKKEIASYISKIIKPNDTVMLNSGTTTFMAFKSFPADYNLSIVTNSISIALEASGNSNYNVILIGGTINPKYQFSYGDDAVNQLKKYHADKLILSVDGIDTENGFTTYYDKEAEIDRIMIKNSDCCIVAADHSKFNRTAFTKISNLSVSDYIVTDSSTAPEFIRELKELGIKTVLA